MRKPRHCSALTLILPLLVAASWAPSTTEAFDVLRGPQGRAVRWPARPVAVFIQAKAQGDLSVAAMSKALVRAIKRWNDVGSERLELVYGGLVGSAPGFDITISFGTPKVAAAERTGQLFMDYDDFGTMQRVEILLDTAVWQFVTAPVPSAKPTMDLESALVHHLGHAVGLAHSRQAEASMYFFSVGTAGRSLETDDRRGLRWLYAADPPASGALCDACDGDGHCGTGTCATWPSKDSYCIKPCQDHKDCPIGFSCGAWGGGQACLPNDRHCAPELATTSASGPCASDLACPEPLGCLTGLGGGLCTAQCFSSCGPYGECRPVLLGNQMPTICLTRGNGLIGDRCLLASDCAQSPPVCAPNMAGGGTCSAPCGNCTKLGAGLACDGGGFCTTKGQLPVGWPCASGFDCQTGKCIRHPGGPFARACASACEVASDCPTGTGCTPMASGAWCLPYGAPVQGAPCATPGACGPGSLCDVGLLPGLGACQVACDPFADGAECPAGQRCVWVGPSSNLAGACRGSGGGEPPGGSCSPTNACRVDLVCAKAGQAATCVKSCNPDGEGGGHSLCGAGEQCVLLNTTTEAKPRRGVCSKSKGPLQQLLPAEDQAATANFAATNISLPGVTPWQPPGQPDTDSEPEPEPGCSAGRSGGPATMAWLWLVALGLLIVRRRHPVGV